MEFFGITLYGPQNYIQDLLKYSYKEPMSKEDVDTLLQVSPKNETTDKKSGEIDIDNIRVIDCYIGRVNGFAYGSFQRFKKMKRKGMVKPIGPSDIYRKPPTSSVEYGWWQYDSDVSEKSWHKSFQRFPQPTSPNTLILNTVRKNNKYATLY